MIIYRLMNINEYGDPKSMRRLSNVVLPGIPYEYNYWDYIDAWDRVLLYQNNFGQHSWFIRTDLVKFAKLASWFS